MGVAGAGVGLGTGELGVSDGVAMGTVVGAGLGVGSAVGEGELLGDGLADAVGLGLGDGDGLGEGDGLAEGDGDGLGAARLGDGVTWAPTANPIDGRGEKTATSGVELALGEPAADGDADGSTTLSFDFSKMAMLASPLAFSVPSEFTLTSSEEPCFSPVPIVPDWT